MAQQAPQCITVLAGSSLHITGSATLFVFYSTPLFDAYTLRHVCLCESLCIISAVRPDNTEREGNPPASTGHLMATFQKFNTFTQCSGCV